MRLFDVGAAKGGKPIFHWARLRLPTLKSEGKGGGLRGSCWERLSWPRFFFLSGRLFETVRMCAFVRRRFGNVGTGLLNAFIWLIDKR